MNKNDLSILVGNALDKFDTSLYGFLAPILGPLFFPHHDPIVQLILTYSTSIVALFSRPLGTFFFGMFAHNYGPRLSLFYSLIGVSITTALIGLIPSHATIGFLAPFILVCIRFLRGICAAGESTVAKLYIMENKIDHDALYASYWYQSSSMLGIIFASAAATTVLNGTPGMWRICFLSAGLTGFFGWYLRNDESHKRIEQNKQLYSGYSYTSLSLLWKHKKNIARIAIVTVFSHITYAIPFVFMNTFVPLVTTITLNTMMLLNSSLLIFDMLLVPSIGRCIIHFTPKTAMLFASSLLSISIIPLFLFLPNASLLYVTCMRIWIIVCGVIFLCPLNFWSKSLFNSSEQYFLIGMGNALGVATLGHATTPICLYLWYITGACYAPAVYITLIMIFCVYAIASSVTTKYENIELLQH